MSMEAAAMHPEVLTVQTQVLSPFVPAHHQSQATPAAPRALQHEELRGVARGVTVGVSSNGDIPMLHSKLVAVESGISSDGSYIGHGAGFRHDLEGPEATTTTTTCCASPDDSAVVDQLEHSHELCDPFEQPLGQSRDTQGQSHAHNGTQDGSRVLRVHRLRTRPLWRNSNSMETDV